MTAKVNKCAWTHYVDDRSICKRSDRLRGEVITVFDKQGITKYVSATLYTSGGKKIRERRFDTHFKASLWCENVRDTGVMPRGKLREVEMKAQFGGVQRRRKVPYKISKTQYDAVTRLKYGSDFMHYYNWVEAKKLLAGEGDKRDLDIVVKACIDKGDKALARELQQSNKA